MDETSPKWGDSSQISCRSGSFLPDTSDVTKIETAIERLHEYRAALITASVTAEIDVGGAVVHEEDTA